MAHSQYQVLLARTALLPGESLPSLLARLSLLNCYDAPDNLSQLLRERGNARDIIKDRITFPRRLGMYQRLKELTCVSIPDLYAASAHQFATVLTPPDTLLEFLELSHDNSVALLAPSLASKQLRPVGAGQFCPLCLQDAAYHRSIWMPIAASACLQHCCLLIDRCEQCDKSLSIHEIVEMRCHKCKGNLVEAKILHLNNDLGLLFQRIIQSWLTNDAISDDIMHILPQEPSRALYRVVDGLQWATRMLGAGWSHLHHVTGHSQAPTFQQGNGQNTITPYESYLLYTTAFKGLVNWPAGFYEFLEGYRYQLRSGKSLNGGPKADLGNLYTQWLQDYWQHPAFEFVQSAFQSYFTDTYSLSSAVVRTNMCLENPGVAEHFSYINVAEAARYLGTTPKTVDMLVKTGRLTCRDLGQTHKRKYRLVNRAELSVLRNEWNEEVSRAEAAKWLGTTEQMIVDLVKVGLLAAERSPADGCPYWKFSRPVLIECLEKVSKHVESFLSQEKTKQGSFINLAKASRQLFVVGLNAASILLSVAEGKLKAYCSAGQVSQLSTLIFDHLDIQKYIQSVKSENGWIGREETARHLGVKDVTLTRWVKHGLISPIATYGHVQYFDQKAITTFITENVTSEEATEILSVGRLTVQKWARLGMLADACVSGPNIDGHHTYLFNREKLTWWRNERLTFGEAVSLLRVSKATFYRWVGEKKVVPLERTGGKQHWFLRKDVEYLLNKPTQQYHNQA